MSKTIQRIFLRGAVYYYRRRIPPLLRASKAHSVIISLNTTNPTTAFKLACWYDARFENLLLQSKMTHTKIDKSSVMDFELEKKPDGTTLIKGTPEELEILVKNGVLNAVNQNIAVYEESKNPLLSKAIEEYFEDKKRFNDGYNIDSKVPGKFRRLIEIVGDRKVNAFEAQDANIIIDVIKLLPANSAGYRGMTVDEILQEEYEEKLSVKSINDHIDLYKNFFNFLHRVYKVHNIFAGLSIKESDKVKIATHELRLNFNRDDLKKLFRHNRFTLGLHDNAYEFWTPLLALYTGARLNEISQLRVYDIKEEDGIPYIDITEERQKHDKEKKKLKNQGSFRKTPIHDDLIKLGFLKYVKSREKEIMLFDGLGKFSQKDGYGRYVGENFARFCRSIEINKTFHCFRGFVATEMRNAGIDELERFRLTGRETRTKTVEEKHYLGKSTLYHLHKELHKLDFKEITRDVMPF